MIVTSQEVVQIPDNMNGKPIVSSITSNVVENHVVLYFKVTGIIVLREANAPLLKGIKLVLFVHVPSG